MTGQEHNALESLRQEFWEFRETVAGQLGTVNGKLNTLLDMYQKDHSQPAGDGGSKVVTKALGMVEKIIVALIGAVAGVVGGYYAGKG